MRISEAPRWDERCMPVPYALNSTLDPIPNPLGEDFLALADARDALQAAFDRWNDVPTSFIEMNIEGSTDNLDIQGFDMVNEITFRTGPNFFALAASPSVALMEDTLFEDGLDIDEDGDSDVSAGISVCQDVDDDGDLEFPEGLYKAGTMLDNDIEFGTGRFRFTTTDAAIDDNFLSSDLLMIAVHEFGHSHGLAHSIVTQNGPDDGNCPVMSATGLDTGDPESEIAQRELRSDDIGFTSLHYPEGTATVGPARLDPGDVAFDTVFGLIEGEVTHGDFDLPVAGAAVTAVEHGSDAVAAQVYSGRVALLYDVTQESIGLWVSPDAILDGKYRLPVPRGAYELKLEAIDDEPNFAFSISTPAVVGSRVGLLEFPEERWNGPQEAALEARPGHGQVIPVQPGRVQSGVDFVTNRVTEIEPFGAWDTFVYRTAPPRTYFAVRLDPQTVLDAAPRGFRIQSVDFLTYHYDRSQVPVFRRALLTTGTETADGAVTVELDHPLAEVRDFVGYDLNRTPWFLGNNGVTRQVIRTAAQDDKDLFLVLQLPEAFTGFHGWGPVFGADVPLPGDDSQPPNSYFSVDGETWFLDLVNYHFSLTLTESP